MRGSWCHILLYYSAVVAWFLVAYMFRGAITLFYYSAFVAWSWVPYVVFRGAIILLYTFPLL